MHSPAQTPYADELLDELLERLTELSEDAPTGGFADLVAMDAELARRLTDDARLAALVEERYAALRQMAGVIGGAKQSQNNYPEIPGFQIVNILGFGGAGVVYRARQTSLKREVALKLIMGGRFASPRQRERFRCEAETIARLHHPHIAEIHDHGEYEGLPYLVQELLSGGTLAERVRRQSLSPRAAAQLVRTVAQAVHYAHQNGVVHRDLKPANILLTDAGEPKVIDFGLAKALDADSGYTRTGETPGTPSYMAPEQITGAAVGPHTDIYGLGAILFELLCGEPPFTGGTSTVIFDRILNTAPALMRRGPRRVPIELQSVTFKCLEKDPRHRYASAADFADDLGRFLADEPVRARTTNALQRLWKWARRRPAVAALLAFSLVAAVVVTAGSMYASLRMARLAREAEEHRQEAEARRVEAQEGQQLLRQQLYAADMTAAYKAYRQNNIVQMQELLARHVPHEQETDLRGFPWYFLDRLRHQEQLTLTGHRGDVYTVLYSPDGTRLATCGKDGTVRLWNARDGKPLAVFAGHAKEKEVNALAFTPDGSKLASVSDDGLLFLWDTSMPTATPEDQIRRVDSQQPFADLSYVLRAVAISPDGKLIAAAGNERKIQLIPLQPKGTHTTLPSQSSSITSLLFSRDGRTLYAAEHRSLRAWDVESGQERWHDKQHEEVIIAICLSHDGDLLVSADTVGQIKCRETKTMERLPSFVTGHDRADALAFSPDDRTLAIGTQDGHFELWDVASRGRRDTIRGHVGALWSANYAPDGSAIATSSKDGLVRIWNLKSSDASRLATNSATYNAIAFSPSGTILAAGTQSGEIELWDWKSAERQHISNFKSQPTPANNGVAVVSIAFSPDGKELASSNANGVVQLSNALDLAPMGELIGMLGQAGSVSYSSDGHTLAVGSQSRGDCARLWQLDTKQASRVDHAWGNEWVQFVKNVPRLAVVSATSGSIRLFHADKNLRLSFSHAELAQLHCFAISDDGRLLATGGGSEDRGVYLWETTTGRSIARFVGHEATVDAVAFCPDQRTLASTGGDGTVRLWDLMARQELFVLDVNGAEGKACSFSPDGQVLAAAVTSPAGQGELHIWSAGVATAAHPSTVLQSVDDLPIADAKELNLANSDPTDLTPYDWQCGEAYISQCGWMIRTVLSRERRLALPTFEEQVRDGIVSHGAVAFNPESGIKQWTGQMPSLAEVEGTNIRRALQLLNDGRPLPKNAGAALVEGEYIAEVERKWSLLLLPESVAERSSIPIAEIGPTDDIFERFRRVHRWAKAHGYPGGFPTFADKRTPTGETYGVVLIKPGMGEEVWVPVQ